MSNIREISKFMSIGMDAEGLNKVTKEAPFSGQLHIDFQGGELTESVLIGSFLKNLECNVYVYGAFSAGVVAFLMIPFKRIRLWNKAIIHMHQPVWSGHNLHKRNDLDTQREIGVIHKKILLDIGNESDHPEAFKREWGAYCVRHSTDTVLTPRVDVNHNPCGPLIDYKKF